MDEYGKSYYAREIRKTKHRRTPPANVSAYAEAQVGTGFNPFLYQAGTAGANAGIKINSQYGGAYTSVGGVYDHTLPATAIVSSQFGIPVQARLESGAFLRYGWRNSQTERGGMAILDGKFTHQNELNTEVGLALFRFPKVNLTTVRYGGWNRATEEAGMKKRAQYYNLPNSYTFRRALGVEVRYAQGAFSQGLVPYQEVTNGAYSVMVHSIDFVGRNGWGVVEDIFKQRWFRREVTAGYTHLPRQIRYTTVELANFTTSQTLDYFWIDANGTVAIGPYYRPMQLTLGATLRFWANPATEDTTLSSFLTRNEDIPESMFSVYAKFRMLQHFQ